MFACPYGEGNLPFVLPSLPVSISWRHCVRVRCASRMACCPFRAYACAMHSALGTHKPEVMSGVNWPFTSGENVPSYGGADRTHVRRYPGSGRNQTLTKPSVNTLLALHWTPPISVGYEHYYYYLQVFKAFSILVLKCISLALASGNLSIILLGYIILRRCKLYLPSSWRERGKREAWLFVSLAQYVRDPFINL